MNYFIWSILAFISFSGAINIATATSANMEAIEKSSSMQFLFELEEPIALHEGEVDTLVILSGELLKREYAEETGEQNNHYWVLKLTLDSFNLAIQTPVLMAFQTPRGIMESRNYNEVQLEGAHGRLLEDWLYAHLNEHVTLQGTLFHAHSGHHHTPIQMDVLKVCD